MIHQATTPITRILNALGGSLYIYNGSTAQSDSVIYTGTTHRDKSPLGVQRVSEALPLAIARKLAANCKNPRDNPDEQGCLHDHCFEVPHGLEYCSFDATLREIAELIWLVGIGGPIPDVGIGVGPGFELHIHQNTAIGGFDVKLDILDTFSRSDPWPQERDPNWIKAQADSPEKALETCIAKLQSQVVDHLKLKQVTNQFKARHTDLAHPNHPNFTARSDGSITMGWRIGLIWYYSTGVDYFHAALNGLQGRLSCSFNAGTGCVLELNHQHEHQQPKRTSSMRPTG